MIKTIKNFFNEKNLIQPIKFAAVGVLNTAVDFLVFFILNTLFGINRFIAQFFSYGAGIANSYFFNSRFTFKSQKTSGEIAKFITLNLLMLAFSMLLLWVFGHFIIFFSDKINNLISKALATLIVLVVNFLGSKFLVFKDKNPGGC